MSRRSMERLSGGQGIIPMGKLSDRTPAEWSDLIRTDPHKAANDMEAVANRDRARGDKLGRLTAALREDAADRLRDRQVRRSQPGPVTQLYFSPYRGAGPDWPRCAFCDRAPVIVSARRDGAFGSALFCAECAPKAREGEPTVVARVPER